MARIPHAVAVVYMKAAKNKRLIVLAKTEKDTLRVCPKYRIIKYTLINLFWQIDFQLSVWSVLLWHS